MSRGEPGRQTVRLVDVALGSGAGVLVGARRRWATWSRVPRGTLLALEQHGLRVATAVSVTGTSAGSIATAVLAAGATVEDLAAHSVGAAPREQFHAAHELIRAADSRRARLDVHAFWRLCDPRRIATIASHVRAGRMVAALAALVPGVFDITRRFDFLDTMAAPPALREWRIVAVDTRGGRHVCTSGLAPLSLAVAASCAVPGIFAAVRHEGRHLSTVASIPRPMPTSPSPTPVISSS